MPMPDSLGTNHRGIDDTHLKLVKYVIVLTKPYQERFLYEGTELIAYPTTLEEFSAKILARWMADVIAGTVSLDPTTLELVIDPKSYRYLMVRIEVVERYPLEEKHYDQRQMKALEAI